MMRGKKKSQQRAIGWARRRPLLASLAAACVFLVGPASGRTTEHEGITLGILPTVNGSSDGFGATFDQHLTLKLSELFEGGKVRPVLLNPGAMYDPSEEEWLNEYGNSAKCDVLLITMLLKTERPAKGNWTIAVQSELLDLKSGKRTGPWTSQVALDRRDAHLDYRRWNATLWSNSIGPSRVFEKQPLGKAMKEVAEQIHEQTLHRLEARRSESGLSPAHGTGGPCDVRLRVLYVSKHAASKSYTIFVDGKDESANVSDGELLLHGKSGTLLLQFAVNDAPYKLPRQEFYQASAEVDCSKQQLSVNIGTSGEALLVWQ